MLVDGRNVYPQDVEATVGGADPAIAINRLAAFAVDRPDGEGVVVVAERYRGADDAGARLGEVERAVRRAVSDQHAVALHDFVLVQPDSIARTSSGKIARQATRTAYLQGELARVEAD
jgi:acyl-CoA synthetase (AMP-forming)/AMP-acid ligase II